MDSLSPRSCPFPGLRPFRDSEHALFFGRSKDIEGLYAKLTDTGRLLAVIGTSGCGKSSLVEAGLLPRLFQIGKGNLSLMRVVRLRPLGAPVVELAKELAHLAVKERQSIFGGLHPSVLASRFRTAMRRTTDGLVEALAEAVPDAAVPVLIFVDQFEELFRYEPKASEDGLPLYRDEAQTFATLLLRAVRARGRRIHVVLTMRSDFFGECGRYRGLAEAVSAGQYLVPRLEREHLQEAVVGPACVAAGLPIEAWPEVVEPAVLQRLLNAAGEETMADPLPVMQHVLMRAWQIAAADPSASSGRIVLRVAHFEEAGDLKGALSRHANEVLERIAAEVGAALPADGIEYLFRALSDTDREGRAVRRPQTFGELLPVIGGEPAAVLRVVDAFRAPGVSFLTPYGPMPIEEGTPVDVSHEALLRRWERIAQDGVDPVTGRPRGWLRMEFQDGLIWRALAVQAQAFQRNSKACLDPATTQERFNWFKGIRRRPAWALRYMVRAKGHLPAEEQPEWVAVGHLLRTSLERWRDTRRRDRKDAAQERKRADLEARGARDAQRAASEALARAAAETEAKWKIHRWLVVAILCAIVAAAGAGFAVWQWDEAETATRAANKALARGIWSDLRFSSAGVPPSPRTSGTLWRLAFASPVLKKDFVDAVDKADMSFVLIGWSGPVMRALWPNGGALLAKTILERLCVTTDPSDASAYAGSLAMLAKWLEPTQAALLASQGAAVMLERLHVTIDPFDAGAWAGSLATLAKWLEPAQAALISSQGTAAVLERLHATADPSAAAALARVLAVLAGPLEPAQAAPTADVVLERLRTTTDLSTAAALENALAALASRLEPPQAVLLASQGTAAALKRFDASVDPSTIAALEQALAVLAEQMEPAQAALFADMALRQLDTTTSPSTAAALERALAALAGRLEPAQAAMLSSQGAAAALKRFGVPTDPSTAATFEQALAALAERMEPAQAALIAPQNAAIVLKWLDVTTDPTTAATLGQALAALARRMEPAQATLLVSQGTAAVLGRLRLYTDPSTAALGQPLAALAQRMEPAQAAPLANTVLNRLGSTTNPSAAAALGQELAVLAGRMEPVEADKVRSKLFKIAWPALAWAGSLDEAASWAKIITASLPLGSGASFSKLVNALRAPMAGGPATNVLLEALRARDPKAPGPAAGWQTNAEWLSSAYPKTNPYGLPVCPPPPPWAESAGAACPP